MRSSAFVVVTLVVAVAALACSTRESTGASAQSIVGGYPDDSAGPVVLLFRCSGACAFTPYLNAEEICSGTLVGPNLVLTARHCVAPQLNADNGVACSQSTFGQEYPADNFVITPAKDAFEGGPWFFVSQVAVDPTGVDVCGHDIATLLLPKPYVGAAPMAVRVASPPVTNELYSAVGYGDDLEGGLGYRHRRDGMKVSCVGTQCKLLGPDLQPLATADEFMGQTGLCGGDSGGPAIDTGGLLFGVTSRGFNCTLPVYERVDVHAPWLQSQAIAAAVAGGYEIPSWAFAALPDSGSDAAIEAGPENDAAPEPADSAPPLPNGSASGGCNASGAHGTIAASASASALALLCLLRLLRRRSKSFS